MNTLKILLAEIRYRKLNFALSLISIVIAVTLFVSGPMLLDAYKRQTDQRLASLENETRKLMLSMGFNLLIVHQDTNMTDFWASDFATKNMPQQFIYRLANDRQITMITHLVATLQKKNRVEQSQSLVSWIHA